MLKKIKFLILNGLAASLFFIASQGFSINCNWAIYEPDVPECLKK